MILVTETTNFIGHTLGYYLVNPSMRGDISLRAANQIHARGNKEEKCLTVYIESYLEGALSLIKSVGHAGVTRLIFIREIKVDEHVSWSHFPYYHLLTLSVFTSLLNTKLKFSVKKHTTKKLG